MRKKQIILILSIIFGIILLKNTYSLGTDISLSDNSITVDSNKISQNSEENVSLSSKMDNGAMSEELVALNVDVTNIININQSGTYELTGNISDGQISINANQINGEVRLILNNVTITCKNAPAIFVYHKDNTATNCEVTIELKNGSKNTITGGKLKQSVEGIEDQEDILYYVEKGNDDDGSYYERYKYDGAISSDISLTFEGEGDLIVKSTEKEGIESKKDITINSGNYTIYSLDDGINASYDGESVITINGGMIAVFLQEEAEEGDGIDSNGSIYINDGYVFAFASEDSQDSGLDSDMGIYINGGYVVGTGNMADSISTESEQKYLQLQFNEKILEDTLITITDKNQNPIVAFIGENSYLVLTMSVPNMIDEDFYVYEGGEIQGTSTNGLYYEITSFEGGTQKNYQLTNDNRNMDFSFNNNKENLAVGLNKNIHLWTLGICGILCFVLILICIYLKKKGEFEMRGKVLILIIGILIGAMISAGGFMIYNQVRMNGKEASFGGDRMNFQDGEMPDAMPQGGMRENGGAQNSVNNENV